MDGQHNRALGNAGEELAARWLTDHGFRVVARNLRTSYGELDVIVEKNGHVHVVEVKTRRGTGYGSPLEAIDHRKQEHLRRSTMAALAAGIPGLTRSIRGIHIDAMSILMSDGTAPVIEFVEDILA
ncbi:YraN family protein [Candidatus Cryosericum hinesii]|uniref:YraN family protein n=1 Tax=Candidatus Cryosericum hinesii TaxID=2290915 RepID=UPI001402562C|nr:YraN family protein [Candidatus Cryosericum hinesii]